MLQLPLIAWFEQHRADQSATWRRVWLALGRSGWMKAWRSAAATMLVCALGTQARALRIQCTRPTLPGGGEDAADGGLQPLMGVGDDQPDAAQAAAMQAVQEVTPALGVCGHSDDCRDTDNAAALTLLEVGGI